MLLLWKSVYPYEYMDDWEKFTETLSEKEDLYIRVNKGDITDAIYTPAKRVCKKFEKKNVNIIVIPWFICSKWYVIGFFSINSTKIHYTHKH